MEADRLLTDQDKYMKHIQSGIPVYLDVIHMIKAGLPSLFSHIGKWSKKKKESGKGWEWG